MRLSLSFDGGQAVILGGPNGYGKTTVFDALELLFTGRIRRMDSYAPLHNNTTSMDQDEQKPLVYDVKSRDAVIVRAGIMLDEGEIILERHAEVYEMRNPVDFGPFQRVFVSNKGIEELQEVASADLGQFGLGDLAANYDFLYYLSQEEAVAFLKSKEADRSRQIQQLFDTTRYEEPIKRLGDAINQLTRLSNDYGQRKKVVDEEIKRLTATSVQDDGGAANYVSLSGNETLAWDKEDLGFSHEDFNMWLAEGGVIDGMLYFCQNKDAFKQNRLNMVVERLLHGSLLRQLVIYMHYKDTNLIGDFKRHRNTRRQFDMLRIDNLAKFAISIPETLLREKVLEEDVLNNLDSIRKSIVNLYNTTNDLARIKTDMMQRRNQLAQILKTTMQRNPVDTCPLCGANYGNEVTLMDHIETYGRQLEQTLGEINQEVLKQFETFRKSFTEQVVEPCEAYYVAKGISDELVALYDGVNGQQALKDAGIIEKIVGKVDYSKPLAETVDQLTKQLAARIVAVDAQINTDWLNRIFNSYLKFTDWRKLTEEQVMAKRAYLASLWNKKVSVMLTEKSAASARFARCIERCEHRKTLYRKVRRSLESQRDGYINEIISDIKILYYIYSGRIMQDCHYGRGLLMKPDFGRRRVLFVAGSYKSDVDALYNMSSGQLVSLSIAFLLALNKLYAHNLVLAIDDPVQTIDDINLWGLIETLRHDFNDHFLLLSTHEQDYSQLLKNKLEKWGVRTRLIDMGEVRKTN